MKKLNELSKSNKIIVVLILAVVAMMLFVSYNSLANNDKDYNDNGGWIVTVKKGNTTLNNNANTQVYINYNNIMVDMDEMLGYIKAVYGNYNVQDFALRIISALKYNEKYSSDDENIPTDHYGLRPYPFVNQTNGYDMIVIDDNKNTVYVPDRYNYYYDSTNYISIDDSVTLDIEEKDGKRYIPLYFFANIPGITVKVDNHEVYKSGNNYLNSIEAINRDEIEHTVDINITQIQNYKNLRKDGSASSYYGEEKGSLWREEALKKIEKNRKNTLKVVVTDRTGQIPLEDVNISIRMKKNNFSFGTMLSDTNSINSNKKLFNSAGISGVFNIDGNDSTRSSSISTLRNKSIDKVKGNYLYNDDVKSAIQSILGDENSTSLNDNDITMAAIQKKVYEYITLNALETHREELNGYTDKVMLRYENLYTSYIDSLMSNNTYKSVDSYDVINNLSDLSRMYKLLYEKSFWSLPNFWESSVYNGISGSVTDYETVNASYSTFLKNIINRLVTKGYSNEKVFSDGGNYGQWVHDSHNTSTTTKTQRIINLIKAIDTSNNSNYTSSIIDAYGLKYKPNSNYSTPQSYNNELNTILNETKIKNGKIAEYDNSDGVALTKEDYLRDVLIMAYSNPDINEFYFSNYYDNNKTSSAERSVYSNFIEGKYFYEEKDLLSYTESYTTDTTGIYERRLYDGEYEVVVTLQDKVVTLDVDLSSDSTEEVKIDIEGLDLIKPTASLGPSVSAAGYTDLDLTCNDNSGVEYWYFGPKSNPVVNSDFTHITNPSQRFTTPTITINSAGVYYYACVDTSGNMSDIGHVEFNKYVLNTHLLKINGQKGTYNPTNYEQTSSKNYFVENDTEIDISNRLGTTPTGSSDNLYRGVTVGDSTNTSTENIIINDNNKVLNAYYDRKEYTLRAVAVNGTNGITLTEVGNNTNSVTSTLTNNNKSITVRHGQQVTASADIANGYGLLNWTGLITTMDNPITFTPTNSGDISVTLRTTQIVRPEANITNNSSGLKLNSVSLTLSCSDSTGLSSYYFGTDLDPDNYTNITGNSTLFTKDVNVSTGGTYYLYCKNTSGNASVGSMITLNNYIVNKMLLNENGTISSHTTTNYTQVDSKTYIGPSNLQLTMNGTNGLKDPMPSNADSYLGHSIGQASTTNVELSNDTPFNNLNNRVYTLWYSRTTSSSGGGETTHTKPAGVIENVTTKAESKNQTVTFKCSSTTENITKLYVGSSSSPSDSDYKNIDSSVASKSYTSATTLDSAGNYYFSCMSESGLKSDIVSQELVSYTINKELLTVTGTKGTLDSTNYKEVSTDSYLLPKGNTLRMSDIAVPTGSSTNGYRGYTIGSDSVTNNNPVINDSKTFNMWFDRNEYIVTLIATSYVPKIEAKNENGQTVTATLENNNIELISRYGEKVEITGTTSDGKSINWGNYSNSTDNTISLSTTSNLIIKVEDPSKNVENPKTGSITHYIKYILLISLVVLVIIFKSFKGIKIN